jgi:hypothetical protein
MLRFSCKIASLCTEDSTRKASLSLSMISSKILSFQLGRLYGDITSEFLKETAIECIRELVVLGENIFNSSIHTRSIFRQVICPNFLLAFTYDSERDESIVPLLKIICQIWSLDSYVKIAKVRLAHYCIKLLRLFIERALFAV